MRQRTTLALDRVGIGNRLFGRYQSSAYSCLTRVRLLPNLIGCARRHGSRVALRIRCVMTLFAATHGWDARWPDLRYNSHRASSA
jgi:hypothetical protein